MHETNSGDGRAASLTDRVRALRLPTGMAAGRRPISWLPWVLCALLACTSLGLLAWGAGKKGEATSQPAAPGTPGSVAATGEVALESKGYIIPVHQIQVSPKVSGMVIKLTPESFGGKGGIEEGRQVVKGEILAQLETVNYQADRDKLRAVLDDKWQKYMELFTGNRPEEIESSKAELGEAKAQLEQLYLDWKRNKTLNSHVLPPKEFEQAQSAYKAMVEKVERIKQAYRLMVIGPRQEKIDAAYAEVLQAEADLWRAEWQLDNCTVRAPESGTILTKKAEEGNIVNPIAFNISASLCDMADLSKLEVDLTIQERDIHNVFKGQKCLIRSEAYPKNHYEGEVSRLMPIADRAKGAVPVRVRVHVPREEEGIYLKPEMSVLVSFLKKKK